MYIGKTKEWEGFVLTQHNSAYDESSKHTLQNVATFTYEKLQKWL